MSALPWVRFFPSDWLAGSRGLSAAETGVYISLIAMMYERGAPLAEDHGRLARLCGASNSQFQKALASLLGEGKIVRVEGGLWNGRVAKEQVYRSEKSEVGKQAAEKRWRKTEQKQQPTDAKAMPRQCQGNANQKPEAREDNPSTPKGVSPPSKRGTRIEGFEPDETVGVELGLSPEQSHREAQKFRDWALAAAGQKGVKLDWPATWRNWARRAVDNLPKPRSGGQHEQHRTHSARPSQHDQILEGVRRSHAGGGFREPVPSGGEGDRPHWSADEHPGGVAARTITLGKRADNSYADREEHPRRYGGARH